MRIAVYVRVSTEEQNPENQLLVCKKYCKDNGHEIVDIYIDKKSGRTENRPEYTRMMKDALYHRFDCVIVWKMDRFSRGGIKQVYKAIDTLASYNIKVYSVTESFLNTENNPTAELILAILSWAANMESKLIGERVKAGINRWKKENPNKRWHSKEWDIDKAMELRKKGLGWRSIEKELQKEGYTITWAAIRKELIKRGFERGVNLPHKKSTGERHPTKPGVLT
jgi:DNA invertase Pin-like site-specific DNA recombinase